jgi:hypothetical protein
MRHGRDHDERRQKAGNQSRSNNTPPDDDALSDGPGQAARPRAGAEVAPTKLAEERERERHRLERQMGRAPGGDGAHLHDTRTGDVTREKLDAAAKEADRRVVGHEIPKQFSPRQGHGRGGVLQRLLDRLLPPPRRKSGA